MSIVAILGAIIAALVAIAGGAARWALGERAERKRAEGARDAEKRARMDDAGRFEDALGTADAQADAARKNVPSDVQGVRDAVGKLGGVPLPEAVTKTERKP